MKSTLNKIKNLIFRIKGENMGYQKIKDLISDIDEFHNEAELREILQEILFICNDNINKKEPSISNQTEKQMIHKKYLDKYFLFLFYHRMLKRARKIKLKTAKEL